jgi:hypothetical protein
MNFSYVVIGGIYMSYKKMAMEHDKKIALVAHDNKKRDLVELNCTLGIGQPG